MTGSNSVSSSGSKRGPLEGLFDVPEDAVAKAVEIAESMRSSGPSASANELYQMCFQLLKLGGLEAEIPRLVVFGQQSMGKTTLLDFIMGGPVGYSSTDTGTKMPVVIMLRPSDDEDIHCRLDGERVDMNALHKAMAAKMQETDEISERELELVISLPGGVHAVFVDLPGIKDDSKQGAELTRAVVRNYVQHNPNDLYILVKKSSDDPANWPWSLRDFILSSPPKGLGLTPHQTLVVGTRALDFLRAERADIRTQAQLLERVQRRAVTDSLGNALPLYLLELFSLPLEVKETGDFAASKLAMRQQVTEGQLQCSEVLHEQFELSGTAVQRQLARFFHVESFHNDLNDKFQKLLTEQLSSLDTRLFAKLSALRQQRSYTQNEVQQRQSGSIREAVRMFVREVVATVEQMMTGSYAIISLDAHGESFLAKHGGTLRENLADGHVLACELYGGADRYPKTFLEVLEAREHQCIERRGAERRAERLSASPPVTADDLGAVCERPKPDAFGRLLPGQYIRMQVSKDNSQMFGFLSKALDGSNSYEAKFLYTAEGTLWETRSVERNRFSVMVPLALLVNAQTVPPSGYRCWLQFTREDKWEGLTAIVIRSVKLERSNFDNGETKWTGNVVYCDLTNPNVISSTPTPEAKVCLLSQVYCDAEMLSPQKMNRGPFAQDRMLDSMMTTTQQVAGEFAEARCLNQLALTQISRWMKFHISNLKPEYAFNDDVIIQLMRTVQHSTDKVNWEPLIANLLQANVSQGMLQVVRLASCATAVALRRILRAALHETVRRASLQNSRGLRLLGESKRFTTQVLLLLEEYCVIRARQCAQAMTDMLFEQTYAVNFDAIEDYFENCRVFERDFLNGSYMASTMETLRNLVFQHSTRSMSMTTNLGKTALRDVINEGVSVQFWVAKQMLAAPLTTKLYMHFIKEIKDKSSHLAAAGDVAACETELEKVLTAGLTTDGDNQLEDDTLQSRYGLHLDVMQWKRKLEGLTNAESFVTAAMSAVQVLRDTINHKGTVDFLSKLSKL